MKKSILINKLLVKIPDSIVFQKLNQYYYFSYLFVVLFLSSPYYIWPSQIKPNPDAWFYLTGSLNLIKFGKYVDTGLLPIINRGPILPILLSLPISLTNNMSPGIASLSIVIFNILGLTLIVFLGEKYFHKGTGFITLVLIISSQYFQEWLFLRVMTDLPQSFLIIFGLAITLVASKKKKWFYYVIIGVTFGLGFLTKESTLLWVPFPIFLWLLNTEKIQRKDIAFNLLFLFSFFITVLPWFIHVYNATGDIYLFGRFNQQLYYVQKLLQNEFLVILSIIVVVLLIAGLYFIINKNKPTVNRIQYINERSIRRITYLLVSLFLIVTFTPVPLQQILVYIWEQLFPIFPIYLAVIGWIFMLRQSDKESEIVRKWILLIIIFSIPTLLIISKWKVQPRNLILFMLINYIIIADAGINLTKQLLKKINKTDYLNSIIFVIFVLFSIYSLSVNIPFFKQRSKLDPYWQPATLSTTWIEKNVPTGSNILMSWWSRDELYFSTKGNYPMIPLYPETADQWDSIEIDASTDLFTKRDHFDGEKPILISMADSNPDRINNFIVIYPSQIISKIQDTKSKYVIISGNHKLSPLGLNLYMRCNPDIQLVNRAFQGNGDGISIYKVTDNVRAYQDCPTVMDSTTLKKILDDSKKSGEYKNDYEILELLGKKITLYPETDVNNLEMYLIMGKSYILNNDGINALYAFRKAADINFKKTFTAVINLKNMNTSNLTSQIIYADLLVRDNNSLEAIEVLREIIELIPLDAFPYYVYSQVLKQNGESSEAINQLEKAIQLSPKDIEYSVFLTHLYASKGEFQKAFQILNYTSDINPNSALLINEKSLLDTFYLASIGKTQKAARLFNQINNIPVTFDNFNNNIFVYERIAPQVNSKIEVEMNSLIYRDVFFQIPAKEVIYMHPPSNMVFDLHVPEYAKLEFSIALSSTVWSGSKGDGVVFNLYVNKEGTKTLIWTKYIDPKTRLSDRGWFDIKIDLQPWTNQKISLQFETDPGPDGNFAYDWAGWGNPRIVVPVKFNFLSQDSFNKSQKSQEDGKQIRIDEMVIDYESRKILFEHPKNTVSYNVILPKNPELRFGIGIDPSVWTPENGDGVGFNIYISQTDKPGVWQRVFYQYLDPKNNPDDRHWKDFIVNLDQLQGKDVNIIFETDLGPNGNSDFDWSAWSEPVLITGVGKNKEIIGAAP